MELENPRPAPRPHPEDMDEGVELAHDGPAPAHDGPQTGVKGVRADAAARAHALRETRRELIAATRAEQERRAIVARGGWGGNIEREAEEARVAAENGEDDEDEGDSDSDEQVKLWRERRLAQLRGGVKDVYGDAFLEAVERPGWVLVVIYEPDVDRCTPVLAEARMLRLNVVSARASRIGFGLLPDDTTTRLDDDDDEDDDWRRVNASSSSWRPGTKGRADPDVLPTVLAYRDGELARTWVRIDLDMKGSLESFLARWVVVYRADGSEGVLGHVRSPVSDDSDGD